ncbi:hypothetical protein RRG08_028755 [Elysia crispata]|uniref:Uncharacterized protein n=1 Tax=Elysia crispata TaxID=231223 RepID=A0AAE0ZMF8_9GAST|nr:hypothetical protein RRG08_028755 [Elysia crispata]
MNLTNAALCLSSNSLKRPRTQTWNLKDEASISNELNCKYTKLMKGQDRDLCLPFNVEQFHPHSKVPSSKGHLDVLRDCMMHAREAEPLLPVSIISNPTYDREASLPVLGSSLQSNQTSSQERTSSSCPECAAGKPGHFQHLGRWQSMDMT